MEDGDEFADFEGVAGCLVAAEGGGDGGWKKESGEHADGGGFAGC